jgi:ferritin-like metal-binding protein YciE
MARAASSEQLREAFEVHLEETRGQVVRLEEVFAVFEEKVRGKHCEGMAGIIEEGNGVMEEDFDDATLDACLIASGQRAEHYEIAAYGTLIAWARTMGHTEVVELLEQTLEEESATDEKLSALAEGGINEEAASAFEMSESDDEDGSGSRRANGSRRASSRRANGSARKSGARKTAGRKSAGRTTARKSAARRGNSSRKRSTRK